MKMEMYIILHGLPGSGKGTQSDNICEKLGIILISIGDLIRDEIKNGTEVGNTVKKSINQIIEDNLL